MHRKLLLLFWLANSLLAVAQTDTVSMAQQLAWKKDFKAANDLLAVYNRHHRDANGIRLQAQVLHWMGKSDEALTLLEPAVDEFSDQPVVRLDFARILFESGRINKARSQYTEYLKYDSTNAEALLHRAYIDRWNGKTQLSANETASFLRLYPDNQNAKDLQQAMREDATPWIQPGVHYLSDDQPLQVFAASLETGWYKSWALAPRLAMNWKNMQGDATNSSLQMSVSNPFYFGATGTTLLLGGGIISQNSNTTPTAIVNLTQKIAKHLSLEAGWEKRPYQHTLISTENILMQQFSHVSLRYNKTDKWMAQASYENQRFEDDNNIKTAYAWFLVPVLQMSKWRLSTGYSIVFADADSSTFRPQKSLSAILATGYPIAGIYDPYFTPANQLTHSVLLASTLSLSKAVAWEIKASAAFAGKADNPYFYLNRTGNQYRVVRSFYQQSYHPFELYTALNWTKSKQSKLSIYYQYASLLFYIRHMAGISYKIPLKHAGQ